MKTLYFLLIALSSFGLTRAQETVADYEEVLLLDRIDFLTDSIPDAIGRYVIDNGTYNLDDSWIDLRFTFAENGNLTFFVHLRSNKSENYGEVEKSAIMGYANLAGFDFIVYSNNRELFKKYATVNKSNQKLRLKCQPDLVSPIIEYPRLIKFYLEKETGSFRPTNGSFRHRLTNKSMRFYKVELDSRLIAIVDSIVLKTGNYPETSLAKMTFSEENAGSHSFVTVYIFPQYYWEVGDTVKDGGAFAYTTIRNRIFFIDGIADCSGQYYEISDSDYAPPAIPTIDEKSRPTKIIHIWKFEKQEEWKLVKSFKFPF